MIDIHIPPAALEAGARAMCHNAYKHLPEMRDQDTYTPDADYWLDQARAAFVAMVEAWPGMHTHEWQRPWLGGMSGTDLILPLTENPDDKS